MKKNRKLIIGIIVISIVLIISLLISGRPSYGKQVSLKIEDNSSVDEISQILIRKEIITNKSVFKFYVFLSGKTNQMKPGHYVFKKNTPYKEVVEGLIKGPKKVLYNLTIPEGFTLNQIATRLNKLGGVDIDRFQSSTKDQNFYKKYDFLKSNKSGTLEGYLFPETYILGAETENDVIVDMMLKQFQEEYNILEKNSLPLKLNLHQLITLASLVEKEAKIAEERPIIAAVIYNRLKKKMKLEIDATIQYALSQRKEKLTLNDLKINSPYNTYKYAGLPPSPICNPGADAIKAALNPTNVDYLYYVLIDEGKGKHFFTNNYGEFLNMKRRTKLRNNANAKS